MSAEYIEPGDQYIRKNSDGTGFYRDQMHYWSDGLHWEDCDFPVDDDVWDVINLDYDEYMRHVATTGDDCLHECIVKRDKRRRTTWYASLGNSLLNEKYGMVIRYVRRRHGKRIGVMQSPKIVREFLTAEMHGRVPTCAVVHSREELTSMLGSNTFTLTKTGLIRFEIENTVPVPEREVRAQCKRIALEHLEK
jgi:hypothetical protein